MVRSPVLLEHIAYKEGEVRIPVVGVLGVMYTAYSVVVTDA